MIGTFPYKLAIKWNDKTDAETVIWLLTLLVLSLSSNGHKQPVYCSTICSTVNKSVNMISSK